MQKYQRDFLDLSTQLGALRFGEFVLKSGRHSPYFFDIGQFKTGIGLASLGRVYAAAIVESGIEFDLLYGPAYKGIPLVVAASVELATQHMRDVSYAFNRKEIKDHGEGGAIVGGPIQGRVLIVDDVISAGTSVRESIEIITRHNATPVGVVIALDRQENQPPQDANSSHMYSIENLPVFAVLKFTDLVAYLAELPEFNSNLQRMVAYQAAYTVT